jgi:hypothetical protein
MKVLTRWLASTGQVLGGTVLELQSTRKRRRALTSSALWSCGYTRILNWDKENSEVRIRRCNQTWERNWNIYHIYTVVFDEYLDRISSQKHIFIVIFIGIPRSTNFHWYLYNWQILLHSTYLLIYNNFVSWHCTISWFDDASLRVE